MPDPNRAMVLRVAEWLGPLQAELVLVGGCASGILISDAEFSGIRPTFDVDLLSNEKSYAALASLSDRLRDAGFREDFSDGAPICRWRREDIILDVMPVESTIFGFGNPWYQSALEQAATALKPDAPLLRVITAPYFLATKITAFQDRGHGDFLQSKDFEDVINVISGRAEIVEELRSASPELRAFVQDSLRAWLAHPNFEALLAYCFLPDESSQARVPLALRRLRALAAP